MRTRPRACGFTVLELLVVIAIVAIIAGTLAVGVARSTPDRLLARSLEEVTMELSVARVEAMQRGHTETVELGLDEGGVRLVRDTRIRTWKTPKVLMTAPTPVTTRFGRPEDSPVEGGVLRATFDSMGRTGARRWEVWVDGAPDRIWVIEFDPVSGAPRLRKPGIAGGPGH